MSKTPRRTLAALQRHRHCRTKTYTKPLRKALSNKAAMVPKLAPNTRYCVVLVDTMEQLEPSDDNYWSAFDLSAFDAVAVARIEENSPTALGFVKGKNRLKSEGSGINVAIQTIDLGRCRLNG